MGGDGPVIGRDAAHWRLWTPPPGSIPTLAVPSLTGVGSVHMIGIGGAGMRNLARLLLARGVSVSGSDIKDAAPLRELAALGARISVGHDPGAVGTPDAVIVSSAIRETDPELVVAREAGVAVWRRQQALAALAQGHRAVAVAGTHGKSTTTSMIGVILDDAGLDPTYLIGGDLNESGSGARSGAGDLFVFEADESDGSFLMIRPWTGVVTNVDVDHVEFYPGGLDEIVDAFGEFVGRCEHVVAWGDDPALRRALLRAGVEATTYGTSAGNELAVQVDRLGPAGARGTIRVGGDAVPVALRVDGAHNLLNAAAAIAVARLAGVDPALAANALAAFEGVHRRFELRGMARGAEFFDDYGHNPAEMAVTVATARRRNPGRLIALVQPHRYPRVQALWRELGASVAAADVVIVTDIYGAAQEPIPGVTGKLVVNGVQLAAPGRRTVYLPHRRDVVDFLDAEVRDGDLVVTMGCGDVWMLGDAARERILERDGGIAGMSDLAAAQAILERALGRRLRTDYPLAPLTTFRIGGRAALYLEPQDQADLFAVHRAVAETDLPVAILGKGSNVLVSDDGFAGLVLRLGRGYRWAARDGDLLSAGGAMPLPALAGIASQHGLTGLEFGVAIPGSLGGAVRMNAGAHGRSLADLVERTELFLLGTGRAEQRTGEEMAFVYRGSALPGDGVVLGATLRLEAGDPVAIRTAMEQARAWRRATQPLAEPNCGSVFENPPGAHAAALIEAAGLKGLRVGDASVSTKHANFIVAGPRATAADVLRLIATVRSRVEDAEGVTLRTEVQLLGGSA